MNNLFNAIKKIISFINNKYSLFIEKHKLLYIFPKNIFLLILFIILSFSSFNIIKNNETVVHKIGSVGEVLDEIVDEKVSVKIDVSEISNIDKIGLYFGTYSRKNDSLYKINIYEDNNIIFQKLFNPKKFKDNQLHLFKSNIKNIKRNSKYVLELEPVDVEKGRGITAYLNNNNTLGYSIVNKSSFYYSVIIVSIIFLILYFLMNVIINKKLIKSDKKFYLIMLFYIIPILFLTPPLEVPDESYHFFKTYKVSQYSISKDSSYNMNKKIVVPNNYDCIYKTFFSNENVINSTNIKTCLKNGNNIIKKITDGSSANRLFVTIPGAIGIKLADILTNSPLIIFYVGRLFMFLVSYLIIIKCFDIIPKDKRLLLTICSIPVFIQQMISYSYDGLLNSLCILLICIIFSNFEKNAKISIKDLVAICLITVMIMIIKLPYVLICSLLLLIDSNKFGDKKYKKYIKLLLTFISILTLYFIAQKIHSYGLESFVNNQTSKNSIMDLISNPKYTVLLVLRTVKYRFMDYYFYSMIGIIGAHKYHLNHLFIDCYYIVIALILLSKESNISKKIRLFSLFIFLLISGSVVLAMFLSWTSKGALIIEGVQGRYFLPIIPLLLISLSSKNKKIDISNTFIYSFINISMLVYIITILVSFY